MANLVVVAVVVENTNKEAVAVVEVAVVSETVEAVAVAVRASTKRKDTNQNLYSILKKVDKDFLSTFFISSILAEQFVFNLHTS